MYGGARYSIGGVNVEVGAVITRIFMTGTVLGRTVKVGGRCSRTSPSEEWVPVVTVNGTIVWESREPAPSYEHACRVAETHAKERLDRAAADLFA